MCIRHAMNSAQNDAGVCGLHSPGDEFVTEDDF